jgi:uncharacterized protein YkwD
MARSDQFVVPRSSRSVNPVDAGDMASIRASIQRFRRPLLSLTLPLLLLGGAAVAADRDGSADDVTAAEAAGASGGGADGTAAGTKSADEVSATTVTTPPSTSATTAPPAPPAPPVTEAPAPAATTPPTPEPEVPPAPEPDPEPYVPPVPEPEPEPAPPPPPPAPAPVVPAPANGDIAAVVDHHNANRMAAGLAPLSYNSCLGGLAQLYSNQLATVLLYLVHQADLGGLVGGCLPDWRRAGENIGYSNTAADVADGFWNSPHHQDNIMNADFTQIGVGAVRSADGRIWITVLFGG